MILDTSFLIDLMDNDAAAISLASTIEEENRTQRIPAQVVYELYVGVGYTDTPADEVEKIQAIIDPDRSSRRRPKSQRSRAGSTGNYAGMGTGCRRTT